MNLFEQVMIDDKSIWDNWLSIFGNVVVAVADELSLFNMLRHKPLDVMEVAQKLMIQPRAAEALVNVLISMGFLLKEKDKVALSHVAYSYLLPNSPFYWGEIYTPFREREEYKRTIAAIKSNNYNFTFGGKKFSDMWEEGDISKQAAANFIHLIHKTMFATAIATAKLGVFKNINNLLDVGGGSGGFSIAYIKHNENVNATIFDLPHVCELAKGYAENYEVLKQIKFYPGNFFKDKWPDEPYDGILFSQIFHDWKPDYCLSLAKQAYNNLIPGGKIFIHEMLLNDDKSGPLTVCYLDLVMLINHGAQQFTKNELVYILEKAGFSKINVVPTFGYYYMITGEK
jgi:acetylserotonin N-methyltransferase